jgi:hypothetical protein
MIVQACAHAEGNTGAGSGSFFLTLQRASGTGVIQFTGGDDQTLIRQTTAGNANVFENFNVIGIVTTGGPYVLECFALATGLDVNLFANRTGLNAFVITR